MTVVTIDLADDSPTGRLGPSCVPTASSTQTSYRKLGRNQLRIGTFPAVDPGDAERLVAAIDHVVARI